MSSKARRLADYRVRVLDQFPADALEAALNQMAADGYVLLHLSPACVAGQPVELPSQIQGVTVTVPSQKTVLQCVFVRPLRQVPRLPGDEWMGDAGEEDDA